MPPQSAAYCFRWLEVIGYPNDGATWDMANAELLGLEEANGIVFQRDAQILGTIEVR